MCVCVHMNHSKVAHGESTPLFSCVSPSRSSSPLDQLSPGTPLPNPRQSWLLHRLPRLVGMQLRRGRLLNPNGKPIELKLWLRDCPVHPTIHLWCSAIKG